MFLTILTPDEAKQARGTVGLLQSKVARATGISRTNLALFEVKKYLLVDTALTTLKQFYQDMGYSFSGKSPVELSVSTPAPATETPKETGLRLVDGYAIPAGITGNEVELILTEILANDTEIEALSGKKSGVNWWSEAPKKKGVNQMLALSARNYVLTRRLQGHDLLNNMARSEETRPEEVTNSMLFNNIVSD